jgi:hypothetical protein
MKVTVAQCAEFADLAERSAVKRFDILVASIGRAMSQTQDLSLNLSIIVKP